MQFFYVIVCYVLDTIIVKQSYILDCIIITYFENNIMIIIN